MPDFKSEIFRVKSLVDQVVDDEKSQTISSKDTGFAWTRTPSNRSNFYVEHKALCDLFSLFEHNWLHDWTWSPEMFFSAHSPFTAKLCRIYSNRGTRFHDQILRGYLCSKKTNKKKTTLYYWCCRLSVHVSTRLLARGDLILPAVDFMADLEKCKLENVKF